MRFVHLWPVLLVVLMGGCGEMSSDGEPSGPVDNRWSDPTLRKIHDYQDAGRLDSLAPYFESDNAAYRREAALACGSMRDYTAVPILLDLLERDPDAGVAGAAAYALGQTGDTTATPALRKALADPNALFARDGGGLFDHVVEALGKLGNRLDLDYVLFQYGDLQTQTHDLGLMRSIFRFGGRNVHSRAAEEFASDLIIDGIDLEAAQLAASYFARRKDLDAAVLQEGILEDFDMITDPVIRMNTVRALKHLDSTEAHPYLWRVLTNPEEDYRTQVNALYSYRPGPDTTALELVPWLTADNHHVALCAAMAIEQHPQNISSDTLFSLAQQQSNWLVRSLLYQSALAAAPRDRLIASVIQRLYLESDARYERGVLLVALAEAPGQVEFLLRQMREGKDVVDRSYAMLAMVVLFGRFEDEIPAAERLAILKEGLKTGDDGIVAAAASELGRENAGYDGLVDDVQFIDEALDAMQLPEMIEAYRLLQTAKYQFTNEERRILRQIDYNHPIDWSVAARLSPDATADLETTRGTITVRLLVEKAPATVVNFVELAEAGFFDRKSFHRVVPNFVVQGGCPRGDGYGSLANTIRTEVPPLYYTTGSVGMASAGPNTESSQLFITHSPTPHLDGRYSIFAEVIGGMDVVHAIRMADRIEKVTVHPAGEPQL